MTKNSVGEDRFAVLDGWRGISITLVLLAHLMPLGPEAWRLNETAGPMGMALFFTLSGFLITHFLMRNDSVVDFLVRRIFRIVPLAWVYLTIVFSFTPTDALTRWAGFLFFSNVPPMWLLPATAHFWSLCVEIHFYAGVALLVVAARRVGLLALPVICIGITTWRIAVGAEISIVTWLRVDEILAGACLALAYHGKLGATLPALIARLTPLLPAVLFIVSCHPASGYMNYARPYLAAALLGTTLLGQSHHGRQLLEGRVLYYLASISFALYVLHPLIGQSWLGSGEVLEKYVKRPLLFAVLFLLAHLSTFQFEKRCIALGRRISRWLRGLRLISR